jgi:pimeloyl-ACP methyl ester carboxylesterase
VAEEIEIRTPHLRLAAQAWGSSSAQPVLALHGWLDNAASYTPLGPLLEGVRLVALELPGHGRSDPRPAGVHYHFVDYVGDVLFAADALGWRRFHLLGHSLGASIASFAAAIAPERVSRLALIEGLGPLAFDAEHNPAALAAAIGQMVALAGKQRTVYPDLETVAQARQAAGTGLSLEAAKLLVKRGTQPVPGGVAWRGDPRVTFKSPMYFSEEQILAFIERIEASTLLIVGEDGYLPRRDFMPARYAKVAKLELHTLRGRHHLHMEEPGAVAEVINAFFRRG